MDEPDYNFEAPAGTYHGSKSVLGLNIDANIDVESDKLFDLHIDVTGLTSLTINCPNEAYSL